MSSSRMKKKPTEYVMKLNTSAKSKPISYRPLLSSKIFAPYCSIHLLLQISAPSGSRTPGSRQSRQKSSLAKKSCQHPLGAEIPKHRPQRPSTKLMSKSRIGRALESQECDCTSNQRLREAADLARISYLVACLNKEIDLKQKALSPFYEGKSSQIQNLKAPLLNGHGEVPSVLPLSGNDNTCRVPDATYKRRFEKKHRRLQPTLKKRRSFGEYKLSHAAAEVGLVEKGAGSSPPERTPHCRDQTHRERACSSTPPERDSPL